MKNFHVGVWSKTNLAVNAHDNSITLFGVDPEFLDFRLDSIQLTLGTIFGNVTGI